MANTVSLYVGPGYGNQPEWDKRQENDIQFIQEIWKTNTRSFNPAAIHTSSESLHTFLAVEFDYHISLQKKHFITIGLAGKRYKKTSFSYSHDAWWDGVYKDFLVLDFYVTQMSIPIGLGMTFPVSDTWKLECETSALISRTTVWLTAFEDSRQGIAYSQVDQKGHAYAVSGRIRIGAEYIISPILNFNCGVLGEIGTVSGFKGFGFTHQEVVLYSYEQKSPVSDTYYYHWKWVDAQQLTVLENTAAVRNITPVSFSLSAVLLYCGVSIPF